MSRPEEQRLAMCSGTMAVALIEVRDGEEPDCAWAQHSRKNYRQGAQQATS